MLTVLALACSLLATTAIGANAAAGSGDAVTTAQLEDREAFAIGRFRDRSDFGDFSTPLNQSLAVLALHRAPDADPSDAAVAVLAAQQCADGGFPDQFRTPSTEGAAPCSSAVDTTAFAVQALDAVGEDDAVRAAADWLLDVQAADGSFGSPDGTNTNSTGLAALALTLAGEDEAAEEARAWVHTQQDGCDTDSPGAIPFNLDDRGAPALSTAQALTGMTGTSLAVVSTDGIAADLPEIACDEPTTELEGAVANEAAAAWLASVLTDDPGIDPSGFGASPGPSIDAMFALAAVGVGGDTVTAIADWLETQTLGYTQGAGFDAADAVYAGASAKLALGMQTVGRDPRSTGGLDLLAQLESTETQATTAVDLSCDASEDGVLPGDEVTCELTGLIAAETVRVGVTVDAPLLDEAVTADREGTASFAFTLPDGLVADDEVTITVDGLGAAGLAGTTLAVGTIDDDAEDDTEDDGTENDGTEDDGTENDGTENDGTENDGTENDGTENDGTEDDVRDEGDVEVDADTDVVVEAAPETATPGTAAPERASRTTAPGGQLARTGFDTGAALLVAGLLLASGTAMLRHGRRRGRTG